MRVITFSLCLVSGVSQTTLLTLLFPSLSPMPILENSSPQFLKFSFLPTLTYDMISSKLGLLYRLQVQLTSKLNLAFKFQILKFNCQQDPRLHSDFLSVFNRHHKFNMSKKTCCLDRPHSSLSLIFVYTVLSA